MRGHGILHYQAIIVAQAPPRGDDHVVALDDGTHLISGGLGGLGLLTARLLATRGAKRFVLSSRSGRVQWGSEGDWSWLSIHADAMPVCCDAADLDSVRAVVSQVQQGGAPLIGVFHAAGVLADATVRNQTMDRFSTVFAPKVHGAGVLHAAGSHCVLQLFHVYSSIAGLIGGAGATPHSAANTWLDSFAHWRRDAGMRAHSIQWGAGLLLRSATQQGLAWTNVQGLTL